MAVNGSAINWNKYLRSPGKIKTTQRCCRNTCPCVISATFIVSISDTYIQGYRKVLGRNNPIFFVYHAVFSTIFNFKENRQNREETA